MTWELLPGKVAVLFFMKDHHVFNYDNDFSFSLISLFSLRSFAAMAE